MAREHKGPPPIVQLRSPAKCLPCLRRPHGAAAAPAPRGGGGAAEAAAAAIAPAIPAGDVKGPPPVALAAAAAVPAKKVYAKVPPPSRTGECTEDVKTANTWMLKPTIMGGSGLDATRRFVARLAVILKTLEAYITSFNGIPYPSLVPDRTSLLKFWVQAPLGHRQVSLPSLPNSVVELSWLAFAYGQAASRPKEINSSLYDKDAMATIDRMSEILTETCRFWCLRKKPLSKETYEAEYRRYIAFTVFYVSRGVGSVRIAEPEKKKDTIDFSTFGDESKGSTHENGKLKDNALTREIARIRANTQRSAAYHGWIPLSVRVFCSIDHAQSILNEQPILDAPPITPDMAEVTTRLRDYMFKQSSYRLSEAYTRVHDDVAFSMILPLGAKDHHMRDDLSAPSGAMELYRSECGDEATNLVLKECHRPGEQLFAAEYKSIKGDPKKAITDALPSAKAAFFLAQYADWLGQKVDGAHFLKEYVVLDCDLRTKEQIIRGKKRNGAHRSPVIVQVASSFFVHNGRQLIRAENTFHALTMWTFLMIYHYRGVLDNGRDLNRRWLSQFTTRTLPFTTRRRKLARAAAPAI